MAPGAALLALGTLGARRYGMRTIGRRWPSTAPRGDYIATCGHCGARWRRSQLRLDGAGVLTCPMEGKGYDAATLLKMEAAEARGRIR